MGRKRGISYKFAFLIIAFTLIFINLSPTVSSGKLSLLIKDKSDYFTTYDELSDLLENLSSLYSDVFSYLSIGKTSQGRDIWLVKISDNVEIDEDEPEVFYTGGMHGNECPAYENVIKSIKSILEIYHNPSINNTLNQRINNVVNNSELFFIPMVNPDGCEACTRKNACPNGCIFGKSLFRGVDLNRNFDYNWNDSNIHPFRYIRIPRSFRELFTIITKPTQMLFERSCIRTPITDFGSILGMGFYRGPKPFSENETASIKNFIETHNISTWIDYHTPGKDIFFPKPWSYKNLADKQVFLSLVENVSNINGYNYEEQRTSSLNSSGCHGEWAYHEHSIYALTIELTKSIESSYDPDIDELESTFYDHLLVNLYVAERLFVSPGS